MAIISHKEGAITGYSSKVPHVPGLYWVLYCAGEQEKEDIVEVDYDHELDEMLVWRIGVRLSTPASRLVGNGYMFGPKVEGPRFETKVANSSS